MVARTICVVERAFLQFGHAPVFVVGEALHHANSCGGSVVEKHVPTPEKVVGNSHSLGLEGVVVRENEDDVGPLFLSGGKRRSDHRQEGEENRECSIFWSLVLRQDALFRNQTNRGSNCGKFISTTQLLRASIWSDFPEKERLCSVGQTEPDLLSRFPGGENDNRVQ